jgi:hypothetical protein
MKSKLMIIILFLAAISFFPNCEKKGPMEKAGEKIDNTIDNIQEKAEDAGKDIKKSVNE